MITLLIIIIIDMINSGGNVVFTMIFVDMYTLFMCYIAYIYIVARMALAVRSVFTL